MHGSNQICTRKSGLGVITLGIYFSNLLTPESSKNLQRAEGTCDRCRNVLRIVNERVVDTSSLSAGAARKFPN